MLNMELSALITETIAAMQKEADALGLRGSL